MASKHLDLEVEHAHREHVAELVLEPHHRHLDQGAGVARRQWRQAADVVHRFASAWSLAPPNSIAALSAAPAPL